MNKKCIHQISSIKKMLNKLEQVFLAETFRINKLILNKYKNHHTGCFIAVEPAFVQPFWDFLNQKMKIDLKPSTIKCLDIVYNEFYYFFNKKTHYKSSLNSSIYMSTDGLKWR